MSLLKHRWNASSFLTLTGDLIKRLATMMEVCKICTVRSPEITSYCHIPNRISLCCLGTPSSEPVFEPCVSPCKQIPDTDEDVHKIYMLEIP